MGHVNIIVAHGHGLLGAHPQQLKKKGGFFWWKGTHRKVKKEEKIHQNSKGDFDPIPLSISFSLSILWHGGTPIYTHLPVLHLFRIFIHYIKVLHIWQTHLEIQTRLPYNWTFLYHGFPHNYYIEIIILACIILWIRNLGGRLGVGTLFSSKKHFFFLLSSCESCYGS